jgi:hypothetical protein
MAANPNPSRITNEMWWLWEQFHKMEPKAQLGGFYANKPGYHNIRGALPRFDYSVVSIKDQLGPADKCAAVDITFPDAQSAHYTLIARYSGRLMASGKDMKDERGNYLREFFGQTNADKHVEGWDYQKVCPSTSADSSHLWHIHISFVRAFVANPKAMRACLSILSAEPVGTWRAKEAALAKGKK